MTPQRRWKKLSAVIIEHPILRELREGNSAHQELSNLAWNPPKREAKNAK